MINTCLLGILTQRIQNRVFRYFFLKWTQQILSRNLPVLLSNPSCTDLVITNSSSNFQNTKAILTGLSDFHKMVISVLKHTFHRSAPTELVYRNYKNFHRVIFKRKLEDKLNQQINEYKHFEQIFLEILNIQCTNKKVTTQS